MLARGYDAYDPVKVTRFDTHTFRNAQLWRARCASRRVSTQRSNAGLRHWTTSAGGTSNILVYAGRFPWTVALL
jgi:hypothetical protein